MEAEPGIEPRSTALQAVASFIDQEVIGYATRYATQLGMKILICRDRIVVRFDFLNIYATAPMLKSRSTHTRASMVQDASDILDLAIVGQSRVTSALQSFSSP